MIPPIVYHSPDGRTQNPSNRNPGKKSFVNREIATRRPLVLVFGGLDPSGAGLQADIETCFALGCHALPIATANTIQSTVQLRSVEGIRPELILQQARHLFRDIGPVGACKIGVLPNAETVEAVVEIIRPWSAQIPVILDPVDTASSGGCLVTRAASAAMRKLLLPLVTLVKPNSFEARTLTGAAALAHAGNELSRATRRGALLTGTDDAHDSYVRHQLYCDGELHSEYRWPKIPGEFHGTGCTLTSAIAALMAQGTTLNCAVATGLSYTWRTVCHAYSIGGRQMIPDRSSAHEHN